MTLRIPLAKPEITHDDREAVMNVLRTPQLSMGPKLREFEEAICEYTGSKYAVAVNSGTSALHLAVRALKLERGAEVILPSFTFSALLNVILQEGLRPKFVDIDPGTYNTTPELIAGAITPRTGLIIAVHTFGFPMDVEALRAVAKHGLSRTGRPRHTVHVIEDACEALGADVHGRKVGAIAEAGLFAFYPNKQITTGEGGMLVTSNQQVAAAAVRLRNQGRDPALGLDQHVETGYSYRISDINCALGISQLSRIEQVVARRQKLAETYDQALASIAEIIRPLLHSNVGKISWFVYPVQLGSEYKAEHRDRMCESLLKKGIATGRYFPPLHRQPVLRSRSFVKSAKAWGTRASIHLRNTESVADRVIALPFFNELTAREIHEVAGALEESIRELRRKM
jgi:perosamine synthetase